MEQAAMFMQTPVLYRGLRLGAPTRSYSQEYLLPQTQAAWSCLALERGVMWSVKPPCFSSVSFQRAGEEEEEQDKGGGHHHESMRHSDSYAFNVSNKK